MHTLGIVAVTVAVIVGGLAVLMVAAGIWARRGEGRPDRPGVETACRFRGGSHLATADERASEAEHGGLYLGEGVMTALVAALRELGVETRNPGADDFGWGVQATLEGRSAYVHLWRDAEQEGDGWLLLVLDPGSGGPGAPEIVPAVRHALGTIAGLDRITWLPRERVPGTYPELLAGRKSGG
jgi:hypothetical protein